MSFSRGWAGGVFALALIGAYSVAAESAVTIRSAPPAKAPRHTFSAMSLAMPLAPGLKSHVHQREVELSALAAAALGDLKREDAAAIAKRLRIGIARDFSHVVEVNAQTAPSSSWTVLPDGSRIWTIHIISRGAIGLRVHLENVSLNSRARLIIYNPSNAPVTATLVPRPIPGGDPDVWTPTVFGEEVVLECQLPSGVEPSATAFSITGISHLYRSMKTAFQPDAGPCEEDISCFPEWKPVGEGIASIDFVEKGTTYLCTGCLLNDADDATFVNYFLTAHHCVNSKTVAATLEALWFYEDENCNDPASLNNGILTSGGADLLATSSSSDFALLRLRQEPPDNVMYEGWTTRLLSGGENVTTIHHPQGFEKKISFGHETLSDSDFWQVEWTVGVTEGGSSGGPLFNADKAVMGQLYGGSSSCDDPHAPDIYGRFDVTYKKIRKWIDNYAFLRMQGVYNGLFADSGNPSTESSGFFTLTLRDQGSYSGSLQVAGKKYSITGQFSDLGLASNSILRPGISPLSVQMILQTNLGTEALTGTVGDGTWSADLLAKRAAFDSRTNPAPFAPKYTMILPGASDATQAPGGYGYAAITVDGSGKLKLTGALGDGTKISQSVPVASDRTFPLYANLYSGKSVLVGWISFDDSLPATDLSGSVFWIKNPQATSRLYPGGFNTALAPFGGIYTPPARGEPILSLTTGTLMFSGGNLSGDFSNDVILSPNNKISNQSPNRLSMTFVLSTGVFNGSVIPPSGTRGIPFHGAVFQDDDRAYGYFLGASESGSVVLQPRP
jgi:hypothetical protein